MVEVNNLSLFRTVLAEKPPTQKEPDSAQKEPKAATQPAQVAGEVELPLYLKAYNWVCGFEGIEKEEEDVKINFAGMYQSKQMRWITRVNSATIFGTGVVMYILFSTGKDLP